LYVSLKIVNVQFAFLGLVKAQNRKLGIS